MAPIPELRPRDGRDIFCQYDVCPAPCTDGEPPTLNKQLDPIRHGGDLAAATARYGAPAGGWVDLSTGISPFAYPLPGLDAEVWQRLPASDRVEALRQAARRAYGVNEHARIAPAPGAQALIDHLPHIGGGVARVAVVSPTYSGHAEAWRRNDHIVTEVSGLPDADDFDVVVITSPNNPDGRLFSRDDLIALADDLGMREGVLVVDESYADVVPHRSLAGEANHRALLILRSFGKFFGLAGLRLGFALGPGRTIGRLEAVLGPWPVSGPAIEIGIAALSDRDWIEAMSVRLVDTAHRLDGMLKEVGFAIVGGTPLFRLAEHEHAARLHRALAVEGVWTRRFDYAPHWLRFGLPASDAAFARLERALATIASDIIVGRTDAGD